MWVAALVISALLCARREPLQEAERLTPGVAAGAVVVRAPWVPVIPSTEEALAEPEEGTHHSAITEHTWAGWANTMIQG